MKTLSLVGLAGMVLATHVHVAAQAQTPAPTPPPELKVKVGDAAPNFALAGSDGKTHRLSDYKGRAVVLAWFPKAFTGG